MQFQGVDVANVPDGQYAPAGHAQRYGDRGEGLFDAVLRCHEYPQIDDVFTFEAVNTVGEIKNKRQSAFRVNARKEGGGRTLFNILWLEKKANSNFMHNQILSPLLNIFPITST